MITMKTTSLLCILWAVFFAYALSSCTADKLPEPDINQSLCDNVTVTYDEHVISIFNSSCNYSRCHDGNSMPPLVNYQDMTPARRDVVHDRILEGSMPPYYAFGPKSLSQAQIDTIVCWKASGYLEN